MISYYYLLLLYLSHPLPSAYGRNRPVVTPFVTLAHFTSPFGCRYDRVALLTSLLPAGRM